MSNSISELLARGRRVRPRQIIQFAILLILAGCEECGGADPTQAAPYLDMMTFPAEMEIPQGQEKTTSTQLFRKGNFEGPVTLSLMDALPTGVTATITPEVIPNSSDRASITFRAAANAPVIPVGAPIRVRILATGAGVKDTNDVTIAVTSSIAPAISVDLVPPNLGMLPGGSGSALLNVGRVGGYGGPINVTLGTVASGLTARLEPNGTTADSWRVVVSAAANRTPQFGQPVVLSIAAPGINVTRTAVLEVDILAPPSFALTMSRDALASPQGGSDTSTVRIGRTNYNGPVTFSLEGAPPGLTIAYQANPSEAEAGRVVVTASGTGSAIVAPGKYTLTLRGRAPVERNIPDAVTQFTYTVTPGNTGGFTLTTGNVSVQQGNFTSTIVSATRTGGYTGPINLGIARADGAPLPTGLSISVDHPQLTQEVTTLRVNTTAATPAGVYAMVLAGAGPGGAPTGSTSFTVTVTAAPRPTTLVIRKVENGSTVATTGETIATGGSVTLTGEVRDQNNQVMSGQGVTWTSSDGTTARVSSAGVVDGLTAGSVTITATLQSDNTIKASLPVTVTAPASAVASIEIEPRNAEITAPASMTFTARLFNAAGEEIAAEAGGSIAWASSVLAVASITPSSGVGTTAEARGANAGVTTIVARYLRNGTQIVQTATPLTVYAAGSAGHQGSVSISTLGNTRSVSKGTPLLFQLIVRNTAGTQVTSGVTPAPSASASVAGITVTPVANPQSEGLPAGYFFRIAVPASVAVGTKFTLRYDVNGAGGEILLTVTP